MRVIYGSPQLDGLAAAAILIRAERLRGGEARFGGTLSFDNAQEQFAAMEKLQGDLVFILDFLPDKLIAFSKHLDTITVRNRIAYWNSHHPHDKFTEDFLKRYVHTTDLSGPVHYAPIPKDKTCAAELACKRFLPNDAVAQRLAQMAHDIEFWKRIDKEAVQLSDLIALGFDPKELIEALSKGVFWSEQYERLRKEYLLKKKAALEDIMSHLVIKKIMDYNFGFTLAQTLLPTADAGHHILENHAGVDVSVVLYRNGKVSFRRRDECQLNLAEMARLFNGGGHSYASGARLNQSITRDTFTQIIFQIDQKIKTLLLA